MTDPDTAALMRRILREDQSAFVHKVFNSLVHGGEFKPNWHHQAILYQLERVRTGEINRLIITLPPRNLKSIIGSVAWPALLLGIDPTLSIICASYSNDLALKFSRDCRSIMGSDWYRSLFPKTILSRERNSEAEFMTTRRGGRMATSVGGTLTGRGGDILIIDDPMKPEEAMSETARKNVLEWFGHTVISRLNDKVEGAIVVIMQRLHEEDLAGHLLEQGGWEHLSLPAIAEHQELIPTGPDRFFERLPNTVLHAAHEPRSALEQIKHAQGSSVFSAQYLQQPVPAEGLLIKREWLRRYTAPPKSEPGDKIIQSWDTASKEGALNDWSVG
ncbi:terminase, partial [Parasphingopyxis lamellibrachiae]